ncbi:TIGR04104 family putative zinc finger protein [Planococcus maritimus]|uniref:TIGR04104 family putative zinc finger protein n=2 Tax=Planococcus maritimus TaxID=192421 RepID=UPI0009F4A746
MHLCLPERMNLMPHCQNCGYQWNWKDMFQLSLKSKQPCRNCDKLQYPTYQSHFWSYMLFLIPFVLVFTFVRIYLEAGWLILLLIFMVHLTLALLLIPFLLKLSNTKHEFQKLI